MVTTFSAFCLMNCIVIISNGSVAQLAEHWSPKPKVPGSSPGALAQALFDSVLDLSLTAGSVCQVSRPVLLGIL